MKDYKDFNYYTYEQDFKVDQKKSKDIGLTWNVIIESINGRKMVPYNIFEHGSFAKALIINNKKYEDDNEFAEQTRQQLMYYFWSKSEWEFIATSWPPYISTEELDRVNNERLKHQNDYKKDPYCLNINHTVKEKIDVADQVLMNWPAFKEYLINNRKYIRKTLPDYLK